MKKFQKIASVTLISSLFGCVGAGSGGVSSGVPSTTSPASSSNTNQSDSSFVKIPVNSSSSVGNVTTSSVNHSLETENFKYIRLQKVTSEQLSAFTNKIYSYSLKTTSSMPSEYGLNHANSALSDTINFFNKSQVVLDQGGFGTCVTFSSAAMMGYLSNFNTASISPLDILFDGYKSAGEQENNSGWNGLQSATQVLDRVVDNGKTKGSGYYNDYENTKNDYDSLSKQYGYKDDISPMFNDIKFKGLYANYFKIIEIPNNIKYISNIKYEKLPVELNNSQNSAQIKQALDEGKKVLIGFLIIDPQGTKKGVNDYMCDKVLSSSGDTAYKYDNQRIVQKLALKNNSWTNPTITNIKGCVAGGHEVMVTSYFTASNGHIMFLIRNSWGDNTGDLGNYYMSDDYANIAINDATAIYRVKA